MGFQITPLDNWKADWIYHDLSELEQQDFTNVFILAPTYILELRKFTHNIKQSIVESDIELKQRFCGEEITHCFIHKSVLKRLTAEGICFLMSRLRSPRYKGNLFIKVFEDRDLK